METHFTFINSRYFPLSYFFIFCHGGIWGHLEPLSCYCSHNCQGDPLKNTCDRLELKRVAGSFQGTARRRVPLEIIIISIIIIINLLIIIILLRWSSQGSFGSSSSCWSSSSSLGQLTILLKRYHHQMPYLCDLVVVSEQSKASRYRVGWALGALAALVVGFVINMTMMTMTMSMTMTMTMTMSIMIQN